MVAAVILLAFAVILVYLVWRRRKYPLAEGLGLLAPLRFPAFLVHRPVLRLANAFLRLPGFPAAGEGLESSTGAFPSRDGTQVDYVIYRKKGGGDLPCLLYFHGGGFFFETAGYLYRKAMDYARGAGCAVMVIRYRTSDRFPYPAAEEDCAAALDYLVSNARSLSVDPRRIALGGDSAGGALAAKLVQTTDHRISFLLLVYPVADNSLKSASMTRFTDSPVWNSGLSRKMWEIYLGGRQDYQSPLALRTSSPLPPAYIELAQYDCLHDEGLELAEKFRSLGAGLELHEVPGTCHGYDVMRRAPVVRKMQECRISALRRALNSDAVPDDNQHDLRRTP